MNPNQFKKFGIVTFSIATLVAMTAVGCGSKSDNPPGYTPSQGAKHASLKQQVNLDDSDELISAGKSSGTSSIMAGMTDPSSVSSAFSAIGGQVMKVLYSVRLDGKAHQFLADFKVERVHSLPQRGQFLVRVKHKELDGGNFYNLGLNYDENQGWFLIKKGQAPIQLTVSSDKYTMYSAEFIGIIPSTGNLIFSNGAYFNANGEAMSLAKNVTVSYVTFVSGDYVAFQRKMDNSTDTIATLLNVKTGARRAFEGYSVPAFAQITDDDGLMSDLSGSKYDPDKSTLTNLIAEMAEKSGKRSNPLALRDVGDCKWFHTSARIPGQNAALLNCYMSKFTPGATVWSGTYTSGYKMVKVAHNSTKAVPNPKTGILEGGWDFEELGETDDFSASTYSYLRAKSDAFLIGNGFAAAPTATKVKLVPLSAGSVSQDLNTDFTSVFAARLTSNHRGVVVYGEDNMGERFIKTFDSTGRQTDQVAIVEQ